MDFQIPQAELEIQPDSPIGLYVRRCRLYIAKLEFDQLSDLASQLKSFCTATRAYPDHFQSRVAQPITTPSPGHSFSHSHPIDHSLFPPLDHPREIDGKEVDPIVQAILELVFDPFHPIFLPG
jgi:hypothetical protein